MSFGEVFHGSAKHTTLGAVHETSYGHGIANAISAHALRVRVGTFLSRIRPENGLLSLDSWKGIRISAWSFGPIDGQICLPCFSPRRPLGGHRLQEVDRALFIDSRGWPHANRCHIRLMRPPSRSEGSISSLFIPNEGSCLKNVGLHRVELLELRNCVEWYRSCRL